MCKRFLSKNEMAEAFSMSLMSVNRGMKKGLFNYVRVGSRILFPSTEVDRLAALACPGGADAPVVAIEGQA